MNKILIALLFVFASAQAIAQNLDFDKAPLSNKVSLDMSIQGLAKDYLLLIESRRVDIRAYEQYVVQVLAGAYEASIKTIVELRKGYELNNGHSRYMPHELYALAKVKQLDSGGVFESAYRSVFKNYLANCTDEQLYSANIVFTTYDKVSQFTKDFTSRYNGITGNYIGHDEALTLLKVYFLYHVFTVTEPIIFRQMKNAEDERYILKEEVVVSPKDGAEITVITVRKRGVRRLPAVLIFTIYADSSNERQATLAAAKGYVGVVATTRGKRLSKNPIEPYKHEYKDVYAIIDWISQQGWNDGKVGMYGGSYNGFTQWASMKEKVHPALKTIIPSVSAAPGIDVPMENNVFYNFSYKWIPYVTNNKFLDNAANFDRERWNRLENDWFSSGKAFCEMDNIDGVSSPVFQEWISHPTYDDYWQSMIPYKEEFSHVNIPILTTTGYYDDGQRGAMYYYTEHLKYNPKAEHYLLIGPYDHWGAQSKSVANLRGYQIDEVAHIAIRQGLAYEWFDYILKGEEKPSILKGKVNFQVMGGNKWMSKPSIAEMSNDTLLFYLSESKKGLPRELVTNKPKRENIFNLNIDLTDRSQMTNSDYYPWPIVKDSIDLKDGLVFVSQPIDEGLIVNGSFSGDLKIIANKKDFDFAVTMYELLPNGKYFHLSYYIGRASHADSRENRALIAPGELSVVSFDNTRIVSKLIAKGSKIVIVVNGNKNSFGQINYGTGGDVSRESIGNATNNPLELKLHSGSSFRIPVWNDKLK